MLSLVIIFEKLNEKINFHTNIQEITINMQND
jgi:hypothetical protein